MTRIVRRSGKSKSAPPRKSPELGDRVRVISQPSWPADREWEPVVGVTGVTREPTFEGYEFLVVADVVGQESPYVSFNCHACDLEVIQ